METVTNPPTSHLTLQRIEAALRSRSQVALLQELSSASVPGAVQFLRALSLCASSMNVEMHTELVEAILRLQWQEDELLASAVCEFVQDLVTASAGFLRTCLGALIESFLPPEGAHSIPWVEEGSGAPGSAERASIHVHTALQGILGACPLGVG
jgi:hypothetical protein